MISIAHILATLKENERGILNYAHEHHISQFIEFSPGKFIGVDAERIPRLNIEQTSGRWSSGTINAVLPKEPAGEGTTVHGQESP